ncbi:hypothetical protein CYY_001099 [Polysphondylium violaceum]|uniref:Uncharacterized protein n=1 Tax=Polysphondylium violaceum TaxID=133409 RepID=A0A8J4Q9U3_9MYCE|nr:hypothetical protein CYY_001099 [Polysphondylium violaceum]
MSDINNNNLEKEIEIDEEDEYLGLRGLEKEDLIETIRDIREEYFELQENYDKLDVKYKDRLKEIEFNRKLLTEREDLLLQLQWDPQQDNAYLVQVGTSDSNQANEIKMKAMMDQMRIMERGIFERDEKIKQMEQVINQYTVQSLNAGLPTAPIQYGAFTTIQPSLSSSTNSMQNTPVQAAPMLARSSSSITDPNTPNAFQKISDYPLRHKFDDGLSVNNPKGFNRSPSFWQSPSQYLSNWWKSSGDNTIRKNEVEMEGEKSTDIPMEVQPSVPIRV